MVKKTIKILVLTIKIMRIKGVKKVFYYKRYIISKIKNTQNNNMGKLEELLILSPLYSKTSKTLVYKYKIPEMN